MTDDLAARAVARRLRGLNMHGADPDVIALEILQVLRGHGWRPMPAATVPPPPSAPIPPERMHTIAAQARQAITHPAPKEAPDAST